LPLPNSFGLGPLLWCRPYDRRTFVPTVASRLVAATSLDRSPKGCFGYMILFSCPRCHSPRLQSPPQLAPQVTQPGNRRSNGQTDSSSSLMATIKQFSTFFFSRRDAPRRNYAVSEMVCEAVKTTPGLRYPISPRPVGALIGPKFLAVLFRKAVVPHLATCLFLFG